MLTVINDAGRRFQARFVRISSFHGEFDQARDGIGVELKEMSDEIIEQISVRYPVHILLRLCDEPSLCLFGQDIAYRLGAKELAQIKEWIAQNVGNGN